MFLLCQPILPGLLKEQIFSKENDEELINHSNIAVCIGKRFSGDLNSLSINRNNIRSDVCSTHTHTHTQTTDVKK